MLNPMQTSTRLNLITSFALVLSTSPLQAAVIAESPVPAKAKPYPLGVCVVSGEKLGGEMGDPYVFTYESREIKLCCESCLKDFNKEPAKFLMKLDQALRNQSKGEKSVTPGSGHRVHNH